MGESDLCTAERILILISSQFYDLIEIFRIGGYAPNTNYLFLGATVQPFEQRVFISDNTCRRLR
jgi:serine/threonine-protein phosphatase PPG1